ncbi:hypothetical protein [Aromatoleum aromaticum]|uniref:hypothetical protein n=1 Tax=Aromatoleum aromaticum TaxID=551760 RepID=UPI00145940AB|nr:hypothetical protein [Aromatoleum aromaticum]NMG56759.1 hypothetical protein [Aromatoleum aromaticum]
MTAGKIVEGLLRRVERPVEVLALEEKPPSAANRSDMKNPASSFEGKLQGHGALLW